MRAENAICDVELTGPADGGFYTSNLSDWVPLCPQLKDSSVRLYWIMRALVIEKWGAVRKLSLAELCHLLPAKPTRGGEPPKPSSLSRIRGLMRELTEVGLITTPEGRRITTSSRARASADALRIRINDRPHEGYRGPRNAFAVLDEIRGPAAAAARTAGARTTAGTRARTAQDVADAGQISVPSGQISDPTGQKSDPGSGGDLRRLDSPPSLPTQSSRSLTLPDAGGNSEGGVPPCGSRERTKLPDQHRAPRPRQDSHRFDQHTTATSAGPRLIRTRERQLPPGAESVIAAIPPEVCRPGTIPWVGLRRAVADLLRGNSTHGIPARSPEQVIARMNRCWYQGRGPERSAPSYVPVSDDEGERPIRNPSSWLAAAILQQDCPRPDCEDGVLLECGSPCLVCRERRAEERAAREGVQRTLRLLQTASAAADVAHTDDSGLATAREEEQVRQVLRRSGMFGELLEHRVQAVMAARAARAQGAGPGHHRPTGSDAAAVRLRRTGGFS